MSAVLDAYIECALWSSTDESGEPLDEGSDVAPEALARMRADVDAFLEFCESSS